MACEHCATIQCSQWKQLLDMTCLIAFSSLRTSTANRGFDGKLGRPEKQKGHLTLTQTELFTAGQSKPVLHSDIPSVTCNREDKPVTLVIRHKDQAAKGRVTSCYMPDAGDEDKIAMWTERQEDRPCLDIERSSMLVVNNFTNLQSFADLVLLLQHMPLQELPVCRSIMQPHHICPGRL